MMENCSKDNLRANITTLISTVFASKDIIQILSDGSSAIGDASNAYSLVRGIYRTVEDHKIRAFVTNLHEAVYSDQNRTKVDSQQIVEYLSNRRTEQIIAEIIDASLHSHSLQCSALLGTFAGGILANQKEIDYQDNVIISALHVMNDDDLHNFFALYTMIREHPNIGSEEGAQCRRISDFSKDVENAGVRRFDMEMTVEKLKNVQAIGYDIGGTGGLGHSWGAFVFNENSERLFELLVSAISKGIIQI